MKYCILIFSVLFLISCKVNTEPKPSTATATAKVVKQEGQKDLSKLHKAYFASGCFWCVEAIYESVIGVEEAVSGYSGGIIKNPSYKQISSGRLRHAEAVEVFYDSTKVDYPTLVKVFFGSHDPTTPNQQGPDRGPQYRSMIYYQNDTEKAIATDFIQRLEAAKAYKNPIVTEVVPLDVFYDAEEYHQDYEKRNPNNGYVKAVSIPRLKRFQAAFPELIKKGH